MRVRKVAVVIVGRQRARDRRTCAGKRTEQCYALGDVIDVHAAAEEDKHAAAVEADAKDGGVEFLLKYNRIALKKRVKIGFK